MDTPARRWVSVREAAELYGLHPKTLFQLCSRRLIPFTRIPSARGGRGQIRVDKIAFDRQLEDGLVIPVEASLDQRRR